MFAQAPADAVAGDETMVLIGPAHRGPARLCALRKDRLGQVHHRGKSTTGRRPVQRGAALAIFVVLLLVLVMLAETRISFR
jgi:hypothetical protein